ncbi:MAG: DEAD/DEAH box helicase [Pirellulaceae bacterium]
MSKLYFSELLPILAKRSKLAAISRLGFANVPLRQHLSEVFERPFGTTGSFLADPTFEAVFGWSLSNSRMSDLASSLLTEELIAAMDKPPKALADDYRFPRSQRPYIHQVESWQILSDPNPQSLVVVASGTGSGKTERFMVPILDRLVKQRQENKGRLTGVRALFLYPLNALINSQRERLRAWTHGFGEDIRFCLYNGNTPERPDPTRLSREYPSEVRDRKTLRSSPPPILVTNATMLEYMLVRTADAPILAQSRGKLEWVVLDEAHTYIGSQAAEAALLIRRVLFAFGVKPEDVRFVATSATIGDPEGEAGRKLRRFLADVAGVEPNRVHLVAGQRLVPSLDHVSPLDETSYEDLRSIEAEKEVSPERFNRLAKSAKARSIRERFVGNAMTPPVAKLSEVTGLLSGKAAEATHEEQMESLKWLDLLTGTRAETEDGKPGDAFLPLRAHLFHQTLSGLWACADTDCAVRTESLTSQLWPFGQIYTEPRKHCDCGSPAYDLVTCAGCATPLLLAGVTSDGYVTHLRRQQVLDEFELEIENAENDEDATDPEHVTSVQQKLLIVNQESDHVGAIDINRVSRQMTESNESTVRVSAIEDVGDFGCPICHGKATLKADLFRFSRLGAPFLIGTIMPTLLEFAPDGEKPAENPWRGRRLLTFNDSRQGTARLAAQLQQDAERMRIRGLIYHISLQHLQVGADTGGKNLRNEIERLKEIQSASPNPALESLIKEKQEELKTLSEIPPIAFNDLVQRLTLEGDLQKMQTNLRTVLAWDVWRCFWD